MKIYLVQLNDGCFSDRINEELGIFSTREKAINYIKNVFPNAVEMTEEDLKKCHWDKNMLGVWVNKQKYDYGYEYEETLDIIEFILDDGVIKNEK